LTKGEENSKTYHIGVETGGTSCKVAIFVAQKDSNTLQRELVKIFPTENPADTVQNMVDWLNSFDGKKYSSMGVASFGPICIDKTSS
jgi:predicted NBD/HSP70 family sugar kinase